MKLPGKPNGEWQEQAEAFEDFAENLLGSIVHFQANRFQTWDGKVQKGWFGSSGRTTTERGRPEFERRKHNISWWQDRLNIQSDKYWVSANYGCDSHCVTGWVHDSKQNTHSPSLLGAYIWRKFGGNWNLDNPRETLGKHKLTSRWKNPATKFKAKEKV